MWDELGEDKARRRRAGVVSGVKNSCGIIPPAGRTRGKPGVLIGASQTAWADVQEVYNPLPWATPTGVGTMSNDEPSRNPPPRQQEPFKSVSSCSAFSCINGVRSSSFDCNWRDTRGEDVFSITRRLSDLQDNTKDYLHM